MTWIEAQTVTQLKENGSKMCEKGNNDGVENTDLSSALIFILDTNVESIFSSASFVRINAESVTRLDFEVELTLSIASLIDAASVTRLDANIESILSSASFVRIHAAFQTNLINCIIYKNRCRGKIRCNRFIIMKSVCHNTIRINRCINIKIRCYDSRRCIFR